mgnify:FL=1
MRKFDINHPQQLLQKFLSDKHCLVILTGAGISVSSGIPTYRDANGDWQHSTPIQHQDFMNHKRSRQRYWLRSFAGWPAIKRAKPSYAHKVINQLEKKGLVELTVTQNVDRLHQKAGSRFVIDLHGRLDRVICLNCKNYCEREWVQNQLKDTNPFLTESRDLGPDGDTDVENHLVHDLIEPICSSCSGILKPDVVFFGGQVDKNLVKQIYQTLENADGLLIIGTSLRVFSGYRFSRYASSINLPIASVNPGLIRGEQLIDTNIRAEADLAFQNIRL